MSDTPRSHNALWAQARRRAFIAGLFTGAAVMLAGILVGLRWLHG